MADVINIKETFNAGEMDLLMLGRLSFEKYPAGCETIENWIVMPQGPLLTRPGFKWAGNAYSDAYDSLMVPFVYSMDQKYALEFSAAGVMQVWINGGQVLHNVDITDITQASQAVVTCSENAYYIAGQTVTIANVTGMTEINGTQTVVSVSGDEVTLDVDSTGFTAYASGGDISGKYQLEHPYTDFTDLKEIDIRQSKDVVYIAHGDYAPRKITRYDHDHWTIETIVFDWPPFRFQNKDDNLKIASSATAKDASTTLTVTGGNIFDDGHVGAYFKMAGGYIEITAVASATSATGTIKSVLSAGTATAAWSEGAWSDYRGYPGAVAIFEERLGWFGTETDIDDTWLSKSQDWEDHGVSDPLIASDALHYQLASDRENRITWAVAGNKLYLGTEGGYWRISGGSLDEALEADVAPQIKHEGRTGASFDRPVVSGRSILYLNRYQDALHELVFYDTQQDAGENSNLTVLSQHLTREYSLYQLSDQEVKGAIILYSIRTDGQLVGMTFLRGHNVVAWHRHITGADASDMFISQCTIPGDTQDELWVCTKRTINGATKRYIEYQVPWFLDGDAEDCFAVDCGLSYHSYFDITNISRGNPAQVTAPGHDFEAGDYVRLRDLTGDSSADDDMANLADIMYKVGTVSGDSFEILEYRDGTNIDTLDYDAFEAGGTVEQMVLTISGLDHLEGRAVSVLQDGQRGPGDLTVSSGSITLDARAAKIHIGLGYTCDGTPLPLENKPGSDTLIQGKKSRIKKMTVRLWRTLGLTIRNPELGREYPVFFTKVGEDQEVPPALFTGDMVVSFPSDQTSMPQYTLRQDAPLPACILMVNCELEVH